MHESNTQVLEQGRIVRHTITCQTQPVSYSTVLNLWQHDQAFRDFFISLLANATFTAYRWETPPITRDTADRPFEFALINDPRFHSRPTDSQTYRNYFTTDNARQGIVTFANLRKDATLIAPSPRGSDNAYGHLAAFIRHAPAAQVDALWKVIGAVVADNLSDKPLWVSTAGGGVAWLHVRLDSRPKYYNFAPYKATN